ncbi:ROK domain containing protein [Rubrobacter xylanophilus DSM 9941]|uniref:ROK domain containing protein n=1 Tax=Rubrobacter xylanophilus (strain DSM 9941 / JCM 11954 / NBRC 16129 / PRD-1) TaxID=266117 RepID=Q1AZ04_RUBXD|nr:ROK family transcriptional regulator [Rubrobacter xylanophilus]ABG03374.1 ROK domain containing protein [Rubrobacter xylanophilus DSM 9941]
MRSGESGTVGQIFGLIRSGRARTRAELAAVTGLTRATVSQRVEVLMEAGLVVETKEGVSTGGRPPMVLGFNKDAGVVLAADLGATHCRLAVADLGGRPLVELPADLDIAQGPDAVLGWVQDRFEELLEEAGRSREEVWGIGVGVPGPVDFARGQAVSPPIMPGWDRVPIPERFRERFGGVPVLVDNDVNIMALGEHRVNWSDVEHLLFVKVATGIGCGIVAGGRIHRGERGAAGDIGHIRISGHEETVCRCGNVACVEAVAGGWALAKQLSGLGYPATGSRDVVGLVRAGNPAAARLVRTAGELIGEVLASLVNFFNPAVIIIGGDLAHAHEQLFAGIRSVVYQRSLPLATRHLQIVPSELDDRAGIHGAAAMVIEHVLRPETIEEMAQERIRRRAGRPAGG